MKLKGQSIKLPNNSEYTLKQQLSEGGFSVIYSTNKPEAICKVQVISQANINQAYTNQKKSLKLLNHQNIVKLYGTVESKVGGNDCGFMIMENCNKGTALSALEQEPGFMPEKSILKIVLDVASALEYMHSRGIAHRDIKLENVLGSESGLYKLCDFGSSSSDVIKMINKDNRAHIQEYIEKTTTPLYRSPEQLDLYSGYEIGTQVDIFALGVLCFMLCFKKQPFETRLSAINKQYFLPNEHPYSQDLIRIIEDCYTVNPKQRPTAALVREQISNLLQRKKAQIDFNYDRELEQTIDQIKRVNEKTFKKTETAEASFFDKVRKIYNQMTTETEGWIVGFIEDNQQPPNLKFNRSIISKCWEKRYKVEKFYQILWRYSEQAKSKCLVTLKLLTLLHNFLRKGPAQGLAFDSPHSPIKLCSKIYNHWKSVEKPSSSQDIKRNIYVILLIRLYCLIIIGKVKLCYQNSDIFEGNYSIVPYLTSKQDNKILKLPLIESMINFLDSCTEFHEVLQKHSYLVDIQRTIILSLVDEQYCLVSTLTFIIAAFKHAIEYVDQDLDMQRLKFKLKQIQAKFKQVYTKLHQLFRQTAKLASLFEHNQFDIPLKVINYIQDIKVDNMKLNEPFKISKFLNYRDNICGLKIPLTYEQVVKNPTFLKDIQNKKSSKECIQINEYKAPKNIKRQSQQAPKSKQSPQTQKQGFTQNKSSPPLSAGFKKKQYQSDFSQFTLNIKPKQQIQESKQLKGIDVDFFNTMEFTHQNLNKDFLTADNNNSKRDDQFADFLSMVDNKIQAGEKVNMKKEKKETLSPVQINKTAVEANKTNGTSGSSPKIEQKSIKKIELINFFQDEQPSTSPTQTSNPPVSPIQYVQSPTSKQTQEQKFLQEKKEMISKITQINITEQNFRSDSFIDLKGFIVEQVKKSAEQYFIEYSQLKFKKKIGFGHSSEVFKGQWRGREVAIKKIKDDMSSPGAEKQFKRQIMTSVKIRHHPQLVTMIGVAQHDNYYYIISEYCNGATLFDILHQSQVPLPWATRISMAKQIAKGMVFLHTNQPPIIHRDLKSLNVLLVNKYSDKHPDSMQIKIADFGLSRDFASTYMTGILGTYVNVVRLQHWMAPQIFNNQPYTLKADVYSFAIVLWEIMARKPPYLNMKNTQALMKFVTIQNGRPDLQQLPADSPQQLVKLMIRCWDRNPEHRPNFNQILDIISTMPMY